MHAVAPLTGWYVPAAQTPQLLWPVLAAKEPGLHAVLLVARAKQWLPAEHAPHAVAPLADWNVPAAHAMQML